MRAATAMSIVVVRALHLGDMLCAVPALRALRAKYPAAHVTLVGLPWARELATRLPRYVDEFVEFPGFPGIPERELDTARLAAFVEEMRSRRFDLAVQLHGSGSYINEFVAMLGARCALAFDETREGSFDDLTLVRWPTRGTEVERLCALGAAAGWPDTGRELELGLADADRDEVAQAAPLLVRARYVCIHPGARFSSRRWPADRFAAIGDLVAQRGVSVALTGTESEAEITAEVASRMRSPVYDLTGLLSLGGFAALIAGASLVVCNDTGTSHVAAAVGTRSVVVASGSDVARWSPHDARRHRVLSHDVPCRPCMHEHCPTGHECALGVSIDDVLLASDQLLEEIDVQA